MPPPMAAAVQGEQRGAGPKRCAADSPTARPFSYTLRMSPARCTDRDVRCVPGGRGRRGPRGG